MTVKKKPALSWDQIEEKAYTEGAMTVDEIKERIRLSRAALPAGTVAGTVDLAPKTQYAILRELKIPKKQWPEYKVTALVSRR